MQSPSEQSTAESRRHERQSEWQTQSEQHNQSCTGRQRRETERWRQRSRPASRNRATESRWTGRESQKEKGRDRRSGAHSYRHEERDRRPVSRTMVHAGLLLNLPACLGTLVSRVYNPAGKEVVGRAPSDQEATPEWHVSPGP